MSTKNTKSSTTATYAETEETIISECTVDTVVQLRGLTPGPVPWTLLLLFNEQVVIEVKWEDDLILELELPLNLKDAESQILIAEKPLIFLLRAPAGKPSKDPDPLNNNDNRAGGTVDLFPLLLGEPTVNVKCRLVIPTTGEESGCKVVVNACINGNLESNNYVPLVLTMNSAHCLPRPAKDGTVFVGAIGLDGIHEPVAMNFGMSLSSSTAKKVVWAAASTAQQMANTATYIPDKDKFFPPDLEQKDTSSCYSVYWNSMKRVLVDPMLLRERFATPFLVELAGVPRAGKIDVRGRYMGFLDCRAMLEPGQFGLTTCTLLKQFVETNLPENVGPLLQLPPMSAKASARDRITTDLIMDEFGHNAYIAVRFDLVEPLIPKAKISYFYEIIGFPVTDEGHNRPEDDLRLDPPPEDPTVDVRRIREEGGALTVHRELSTLACRSVIPMNQSMKRTAANRLLTRVRTMLKQFAPAECSYVDWQDTVTSQHAASRRAVTASFAPQPPSPRSSTRVAAARCRMAGDTRIADNILATNLEIRENHPRILLSKVLRCLEARHDREAKKYLLKALSNQPRNRYLLWVYAGLEFDKGEEALVSASAALRIATKSDYSDGTTSAIGWAAVHAIQHLRGNDYAAFVALKRMRKSYELLKEWNKFLQQWVETSGEEEIIWHPAEVNSNNPMLIASAFFLCLRCYKFSEKLLRCFEEGCATRGNYRGLITKLCPDIFYLRAASLLMRRQIDKALEMTDYGILKFGPSAILAQMRTACLQRAQGWNEQCEAALLGAERAGSAECPMLLLESAVALMNTNPQVALQRAARSHKVTPCAHSALIIGRIYARLCDEEMAERWAAAAVKAEPQLSDGWAFLALLAFRKRAVHEARMMLRTAVQVGPISADIQEDIKKLMDILKVEVFSDEMTKKLCFCDYIK